MFYLSLLKDAFYAFLEESFPPRLPKFDREDITEVLFDHYLANRKGENPQNGMIVGVRIVRVTEAT